MASDALQPKAGFDWRRVRWGGPRERLSDTCSYCGAVIPDESIPLRLWNSLGYGAVFCDKCMAVWWGMVPLHDAEEDDGA